MTRATSILVLSMIVSGSLNTLVRKAQMVTCTASEFQPVNPSAKGHCENSSEEPFDKPWIGNLFMFIGEVLLFPIVARESRQVRPQPLSEGSSSATMPWYYFAAPATLDVLGSGLSGVSMLFISASVWQMLRGSMIIYTAILSVLYLGRRLSNQHITGSLIATLGLTLVGISAYLDSEQSSISSMLHLVRDDHSTQVVFGITLTVLSQLCSAIQVVVEESLLKSSAARGFASPSPARVVAFEGLCGIIIMIVLLVCMQLAPGDDHGSYENSIDSMDKMGHNSTLLGLVVAYCISIALFNQCGMAVSKYLSSLHRTLIDSLRAVVVWGVQLCLYYAYDSETYGIQWTPNSMIQLVGFLFLVFGTLVYNEVVILFKSAVPETITERMIPDPRDPGE